MNQPLNARATLDKKPEAPKAEVIDLPQTCVRMMEALETIAEMLELSAIEKGVLKKEDALYAVEDDEADPA